MCRMVADRVPLVSAVPKNLRIWSVPEQGLWYSLEGTISPDVAGNLQMSRISPPQFSLFRHPGP